MIHVATITAVIVGLVFLFLGQFIPQVMNISVGSFAIAGGLKAISKVFNLLLAAIACSGANRPPLRTKSATLPEQIGHPCRVAWETG